MHYKFSFRVSYMGSPIISEQPVLTSHRGTPLLVANGCKIMNKTNTQNNTNTARIKLNTANHCTLVNYNQSNVTDIILSNNKLLWRETTGMLFCLPLEFLRFPTYSFNARNCDSLYFKTHLSCHYNHMRYAYGSMPSQTVDCQPPVTFLLFHLFYGLTLFPVSLSWKIWREGAQTLLLFIALNLYLHNSIQ